MQKFSFFAKIFVFSRNLICFAKKKRKMKSFAKLSSRILFFLIQKFLSQNFLSRKNAKFREKVCKIQKIWLMKIRVCGQRLSFFIRAGFYEYVNILLTSKIDILFINYAEIQIVRNILHQFSRPGFLPETALQCIVIRWSIYLYIYDTS